MGLQAASHSRIVLAGLPGGMVINASSDPALVNQRPGARSLLDQGDNLATRLRHRVKIRLIKIGVCYGDTGYLKYRAQGFTGLHKGLEPRTRKSRSKMLSVFLWGHLDSSAPSLFLLSLLTGCHSLDCHM